MNNKLAQLKKVTVRSQGSNGPITLSLRNNTKYGGVLGGNAPCTLKTLGYLGLAKFQNNIMGSINLKGIGYWATNIRDRHLKRTGEKDGKKS